MFSPLPSFILILSLLCWTAHATDVSVSLSAPSAAATLDPALLSFSIEQDRWTDWAGTSSPNSFFRNSLANLAQRTGQTPWVRIGADSEDHTNFDARVQVVLLRHLQISCFICFLSFQRQYSQQQHRQYRTPKPQILPLV